MKTIGALLVLIAFSAGAQPATIRPPAPTVHDQIVAHITTPCIGFQPESVVISGNRIDVTIGLDGACLTQVSSVDVLIGRLPSGSYTLFVTRREDTFLSGPFQAIFFQVQDASVPVLDPRAAILLAAALASIGVLLLRTVR